MRQIGSPPEAEGTALTLRDLWQTLGRQRWLIVGSVATMLALGGLLLFLVRPIYESEAILQVVERESTGPLLADLPELADLMIPGGTGTRIETDVGILQSRRIAEHVIRSLGLQVEMRSPAVPRDSILTIVRPPDDVSRTRYTLRRQADGSYQVDGNGPPIRLTPGDTVDLGDLAIVLSPTVAALAPAKIRLETRPFQKTLERFRKTLEVGRQGARSELVDVAYRSPDRLLAAQVVDSVVAAFLRYRESTDRGDLRHRIESLQRQVADYQAQLQSAENELRAFRERFRIIEPIEEATQQVEMLASVRIEREEAVIERDALLMTLARVDPNDPDSDFARQLSAFPTFIANEGVQSILAALTAAEDARSNLLVLRTSENPDVQRLDERIAELEGQLYRLATSYLESLENTISSADSALARFGAEASALPAREVEYARLERQRRLLSEIYVSLRGQLEEANVRYATAPDPVRVVDTALVPREPVWPRPLLTLALAGGLGLLIGMMLSVGREAIDDTVRSQWDAEAVAGLPVITAIPRFEQPRVGTGLGGPSRWLPGSRRRIQAGPDRLTIVGGNDVPEALRLIPAGIGWAEPEAPPRSLVVTSPGEGDGKSNTAANLALAFVQAGLNTLLVDADSRSGTLAHIIGGSSEPGFSDVIAGRSTPAAAIQRIEIPHVGGLDFLPSGSRPSHPSKRLESDATRRLLAELRDSYDRVVVDSPALLRHADAAFLATTADAVLLVVRAGATEKEALRQSALQLERMRIPVAGIILNDVEDRIDWLRPRWPWTTPNGSGR